MAIKGYRWYRTDDEHRLNPVSTKIGTADDHIIAPATCYNHESCELGWRMGVSIITPPTPDHGCGYYGYYTMADALLRDHARLVSQTDTALVEILAWGRMQHHRWGFRAERIALSAVFVAGPADLEIADRYLCNKRSWDEAMEMLTEAEARQLWRMQEQLTDRRRQ